jgi:hypothetical protein
MLGRQGLAPVGGGSTMEVIFEQGEGGGGVQREDKHPIRNAPCPYLPLPRTRLTAASCSAGPRGNCKAGRCGRPAPGHHETRHTGGRAGQGKGHVGRQDGKRKCHNAILHMRYVTRDTQAMITLPTKASPQMTEGSKDKIAKYSSQISATQAKLQAAKLHVQRR